MGSIRRGRQAGNLPAETTSFVGRGAELAQLSGQLKQARLVTLTGVGGVGKTRLALRAAGENQAAFPDGVWLVELSPLQDPALVGHVIFEKLPLADQTARPVVEVLIEWLVDKRLLLVLDTCEHLVDTCARLADLLLESAPGLHILATSRQCLDLAREREVALAPLPAVPRSDSGPSDAVVLFAERAAAVMPGFVLTESNEEAVTGICRRLEGIPLAIELAAARLPELSVDELEQRLHARFDLLTAQETGDNEAGLLPRHQTLRTAIGWSHELCAPLERLLWARLSVFTGGFDADAAKEVCSGGPLSAQQIPRLLYGMVDKSIIIEQEDPPGPDSVPERYRMLDTVREYGRQWLRELGEEERTQRRHRDFYLAFALRGDAEWIGPDQVAWYERSVAERANLRAALEFSLAEPDGRTALELAGALWFFWHCGFRREGRRYLEQALAADSRPGPARTRALWTCAAIAVSQGDSEAGMRLGTVCQEAAQAQGDLGGVRAAAYPIGTSLYHKEELAAAAVVFDQALAPPLPGSSGGYQLAAWLLTQGMRAFVHIQQTELDQAAAVTEELWAECEQRGDRWMRALPGWLRAWGDLGRGEVASAAAHGRASLAIWWQLQDSTGIGLGVDTLASAAAAQGEGERAARLFGLGQQLWQLVGRQQAGAQWLVAARERCERQAREAIGDTAYEAARTAGAEMDPEAGIAYALATPPPSTT
ncbi:hypothetical protein HUT19_39250 [Streptomyces sp. NA02950]|uniref:ATP-binding protein n=1 Tax=Streptomyces sp. NA02950 TaxID=2742137 RepID=UPI001590286C|nr:hypothetical protein [Streptomyces sp. NA02950]QKV96992.1 hypothetical protein HUT19_39250 [Streptomyces sp. NA02950]